MSKFINPYTFFPIEDKEPDRKKVEDLDDEKTLSGYLTCEFDIKSPVFIPNTTKKFRYLGDDGEAKEHFFSEFYSYDDLSGIKNHDIPENPPYAPRIPGSEFRGMVRNLYEQLTNSCFSQIDAENFPHKRSVRVKNAGLLDLVSNKLYEAERLMLNTSGSIGYQMGLDVKSMNLKTGNTVYIKRSAQAYITSKNYNTGTYVVEDLKQGDDVELKTDKKFNKLTESDLEKSGYEKGYVLIGNSFGKKHHDSVLVMKKVGNIATMLKKITKVERENFVRVLDRYGSNEKKADNLHNYREYYDKRKKIAEDYKRNNKTTPVFMPVFYSRVYDNNSNNNSKSVYYLSASMYTVEFFAETINSILKKDNKHNKCDGRGRCFCPACRLFGMVGEENSLASRLRFTDSEIINNPLFDEPGLLAVLGTPRISSVEFYLKKPEAYENKKCISWNYDYNIYGDIANNGSITNEEVVLNDKKRVAKLKGRKIYWYGRDGFSGQEKASLIKESYDKDQDKLEFVKAKCLKMTQAVRAIKSGSSSFKIFFEDISEAELKALIFCLNLGDFAGNNEKLCHRIGRGKPYGMGAIKLKITDLKLVEYEIKGDKVSVNNTSKKNGLSSYALDDDEYKESRKYIVTYSTKLENADAALVSYPKLEENSKEIFKWFAYNRGYGKLGRDNIIQVLPDLNSNEIKLEKKPQNPGIVRGRAGGGRRGR